MASQGRIYLSPSRPRKRRNGFRFIKGGSKKKKTQPHPYRVLSGSEKPAENPSHIF